MSTTPSDDTRHGPTVPQAQIPPWLHALTDDVTAVTTWLAAQPVPALHAPAAAVAQPLPLPCGSGGR